LNPVGAFANPILLARRQNYRSVMASSYDRRGGNHDWSNYLRREGREAVMMEATGPGCITRIWTADPQKGTLRIYVDGECIVETAFAEFFDGRPLTFGIGGESPENYARAKEEHLPMGFTSYAPIPFHRSCKVTIDPEDDYLYYQVCAQLHPPGIEFEPSIDGAERVIRGWEQGAPLVEMPSSFEEAHVLEPGDEKRLWRDPWYPRSC